MENVDALINSVTNKLEYCNGKPVAAFTIYKCPLLHWKSFEAESKSVFDHLIQLIGSAIDQNEDDNDYMAYWLSNTSALLFLLQQSLKTSGGFRSSPSSANLAAALSVVRRVEAENPVLLFKQQLQAYVLKIYGIIRDNLKKELSSLLSLCIQGFRSSPSSANLAAALSVVRQVEAENPVLLFKQQLQAYVEKIYGIIRDNLKKELSSLLSLCIQAPRTSEGSFGKDNSTSSHWQSIIDCLSTILSTLKQNFVPPVLVQKIFSQTFAYINVQLFNSLLLRRDCCTLSNGQYVKAGLAKLEQWCCKAKEEYAGSSWDELKHIRQAVGFLVINRKYRISYDEITNDLCPNLSARQLCKICTLYRDENYNTRSVSSNVISSLRVLMTESSCDATCNSFLLVDNSK